MTRLISIVIAALFAACSSEQVAKVQFDEAFQFVEGIPLSDRHTGPARITIPTIEHHVSHLRIPRVPVGWTRLLCLPGIVSTARRPLESADFRRTNVPEALADYAGRENPVILKYRLRKELMD